MGALVLLWTVGFPFLAQIGAIRIKLGAANIGAGFLLIAPFWLALILMGVSVFFRPTRLLSFGLAIPLLLLQLGQLILLALSLGPLVTLFLNLPSGVVLLCVGVVAYLTA
jgi:hypothetical protein